MDAEGTDPGADGPLPAGAALPAGKLPAPLLGELLRSASRRDPAVRLGPAVGEDAAAIDVPAGTLVAATDPITLTTGAAGRYAVAINANDVAVTGVAPRWFLVVALLPPGTGAGLVRELFAEMTAALDQIGATAVGGHTEVTAAVTQPVLVGQMLGLATDPREVVTTAGARPGDLVVQVGPAPVEGAAVLAAECRAHLGALDAEVLDAALRAAEDPGISVVGPALAAAELGATAMHDPTEGGLAAGLHEVALAAGVGLRVDAAAVAWFAPGLAVCRALGADPWATLASGCLLATLPPAGAGDAVAALRETGRQAAVIGEVVAGAGVTLDGADLAFPDRDEVARLLGAGGDGAA